MEWTPLLAGNLLGGRLAVLGGLLLPGLILLLVSLEPFVLLVLCLGATNLTVVLLASPGLALTSEVDSKVILMGHEIVKLL